jgi:hypothetical protein
MSEEVMESRRKLRRVLGRVERHSPGEVVVRLRDRRLACGEVGLGLLALLRDRRSRRLRRGRAVALRRALRLGVCGESLLLGLPQRREFVGLAGDARF